MQKVTAGMQEERQRSGILLIAASLDFKLKNTN
jgi:hypothetical protein